MDRDQYFGPQDTSLNSSQTHDYGAPSPQVPDAPAANNHDVPTTAAESRACEPRLSAIPHTAAHNVRFRPLDRNQSAIRLRRLRGATIGADVAPRPIERTATPVVQDAPTSNRRRSSSEPGQLPAPDSITAGDITMKPLPPVPEGATNTAPPDVVAAHQRGFNPFRRRRQDQAGAVRRIPVQLGSDCYDSRIVDYLDVIDPEVATLSSITNVQNSLFVPSLGRWVNRRPTYDLSHLPPMPGTFPASAEDLSTKPKPQEGQGEEEEPRPPIPHTHSLSSVLTAPQYAVLPDDATLDGWKAEDIKLLNDYVRHMLHSRRSKVKQRFKAFGKYARRPLGFFVTLYATLITLFGLAWVLFLIGWIYVGEKQLYVINVIDYVLVALFAIVGDGLAPFRAVDTYHMIYVAHYHRKTWKLRNKLLLPDLKDHNDLPTGDENGKNSADVEAQGGLKKDKDYYFPVLSDEEQDLLIHHQTKLAKSHTFYKPHETETHHAFPLRLLVTVVLLLDLHSCLQITLGAVTWGMDYSIRPVAVTTTVLCLSIATNAAAGIVITIGDRRTRKKDVLERLMKQELTAEAMGKVEKKKQKEQEQREDGDETKVLGIAVPWAEKTRKSTDRPSESSTRKSRDEAGGFDPTAPRRLVKRSESHTPVPGEFPIGTP